MPIYDAYPSEIYRVDAIRYFFLYVKGGFYVDMDTECLKSLEPLRSINGVVLGRMDLEDAWEHSIPNAIMASNPKEPFWILVIALMLDLAKKDLLPEWATGPVLLKQAYDVYQSDVDQSLAKINAILQQLPLDLQPYQKRSTITLLPPESFYPINWRNHPGKEELYMPSIQEKVSYTREQLLQWFPDSYMVTFWTHSWQPPRFGWFRNVKRFFSQKKEDKP